MTRPESTYSEPITGAQALAEGALAAGVQVVAGYPGSPATTVLDHLAQFDLRYVGWAANEKVAAEIVAGASLGGSRSALVLKSVGLNIALDPLSTLSMTGCRAGMVILLGDDPGATGSQNEQDSRWLARTAELPVVEPTSVADAAALVSQAFAWSESAETPIIVRFTTSLSRATGRCNEPWKLPPSARRFLHKEYRWISYPPVAQRRHKALRRRLRAVAGMFEASPYDRATGSGTLGVVAVGHIAARIADLLPTLPVERAGDPPALLSLASSWPLPEQSLGHWLTRRERVLVLEEGGPFVEEQIAALCQRHRIQVEILGRHNDIIPNQGALSAAPIAKGLNALDPRFGTLPPDASQPMPVDLCHGCLYRPLFASLTKAMNTIGRRQFITVGETGCVVRGLTQDETLLDVKLSLGSALGLGLGLAASSSKQRVVALVGDSSLFHSDINALPQLAESQPNMLLVVLQNGSAALTGGQTYPSGERNPTELIAAILDAVGLTAQIVDSRDAVNTEAAIREGLNAQGLRILIVDAPCTRHSPEVAQ